MSAKVVGYEKVRVRAGEFDAYKLNWKSSGTASHGDAYTTDITYWYAPAARAIVKSDMFTGGAPEITFELVELQLQP